VNHGSEGPGYQPFEREQGVLCCIDASGDELRAHRDERGRFHFHRWRVHPDGWWMSPVAFGLEAGEIRDAARVLSGQPDL
jgi:hypothetical protein